MSRLLVVTWIVGASFCLAGCLVGLGVAGFGVATGVFVGPILIVCLSSALIGSFLLCAVSLGVVGKDAFREKRPYAASESVATFKKAQWSLDEDGCWHLDDAEWQFESQMAPEDVRYQFREWCLLTPGHLAEVLNRLK